MMFLCILYFFVSLLDETKIYSSMFSLSSSYPPSQQCIGNYCFGAIYNTVGGQYKGGMTGISGKETHHNIKCILNTAYKCLTKDHIIIKNELLSFVAT